MLEEDNDQQKAIRLLNGQLGQLQIVRGLNGAHPDFKAWRDTTMEILERFLSKESHHTTRLRETKFFGRSQVQMVYPGARRLPQGYEDREQAEAFQKGCAIVDASLRAAIKHVTEFGVHVEQPKPMPSGRGRGKSGGVSQNFHGPVSIQNLAIAADSAVQKIGHMGDEAGVSLKEIADLLRQSEELSPRQVKEGLAHIEAVAVEVAKPEKNRNWKAVLDCGQKVLDITSKATDLAHKLALYTPAIIALVDHAKHFIK